MPTKFFYGQDQSSLQPAEVLQSSLPLPQHITFSELLFTVRADIQKKPTDSHMQGSAARTHPKRGCLHAA